MNKLLIGACCLLLGNMPTRQIQAQSEQTIKVQVSIEDPNRDDDAWTVTVSPVPVGGQASGIVVSNRTNPRMPATNIVTLTQGKQYTFKLSRDAAQQTPPTDEYKIIFTKATPEGGIGGDPDWKADSGNSPLQDSFSWPSPTKPPTVTGVHWTFTSSPKVVVTTQDGTQTPAVKTYLDSDKASNNKMTICSAIRFYGAGSVSNITSNRNAGGNIVDKFTPTSGSPGQAGYFQTVMKTTDTEAASGSVTVKGTIGSDTLSATPFNLLPAVCASKYHVTLYWTVRESGFYAGGNWNLNKVSVPGVNEKYAQSFVNHVKIEGIGLLMNPVFIKNQRYESYRWSQCTTG